MNKEGSRKEKTGEEAKKLSAVADNLHRKARQKTVSRVGYRQLPKERISGSMARILGYYDLGILRI